MERTLSATYATKHLLSFYRRGNREYNNNSNTATIDNNNQVGWRLMLTSADAGKSISKKQLIF